MSDDTEAPSTKAAGAPTDDAIRTLLQRLARRHPSGGTVIERAAIMAEGSDGSAVVAWITAHDGEPEAAASPSSKGGLHGQRLDDPIAAGRRPPVRYVLPPGALD